VSLSWKRRSYRQTRGPRSYVEEVQQGRLPDRRFAKQLPDPGSRYGELTLSSKSGLREQYLFSNAEKAQRFAEAFAGHQSRVRALGLGSPAGDDSNDAAVVRAKKTQEPCSLKSVSSWKNVSPVSPQHTSKIMERFAREFKADVEALNGTTTPGALERWCTRWRLFPSFGEFLNSVPVTTDLRDAALSGTTDMVRDVLAAGPHRAREERNRPRCEPRTAVAREAERTLGKRKGNGSPQRRTRKRSITPAQENKAVPGANGASAPKTPRKNTAIRQPRVADFAFSGFDLGSPSRTDLQKSAAVVPSESRKATIWFSGEDPETSTIPMLFRCCCPDGMHLGFVPAKRDVTATARREDACGSGSCDGPRCTMMSCLATESSAQRMTRRSSCLRGRPCLRRQGAVSVTPSNWGRNELD